MEWFFISGLLVIITGIPTYKTRQDQKHHLRLLGFPRPKQAYTNEQIRVAGHQLNLHSQQLSQLDKEYRIAIQLYHANKLSQQQLNKISDRIDIIEQDFQRLKQYYRRYGP